MFIEDNILKIRAKHATVIVAPVSMREILMKDAHEQGHFGPEKVLQKLRTGWWRPGISREVTTFCKECSVC